MDMPNEVVNAMPGLPLAVAEGVAAPLGGADAYGDEPPAREPCLHDWLVAVDQCADIEAAIRELGAWDDPEQRESLLREHREWAGERDRIGAALGL